MKQNAHAIAWTSARFVLSEYLSYLLAGFQDVIRINGKRLISSLRLIGPLRWGWIGSHKPASWPFRPQRYKLFLYARQKSSKIFSQSLLNKKKERCRSFSFRTWMWWRGITIAPSVSTRWWSILCSINNYPMAALQPNRLFRNIRLKNATSCLIIWKIRNYRLPLHPNICIIVSVC